MSKRSHQQLFSHMQEEVKALEANPAYNRQESEPMYEYIDPEFFNRDRQKPEEEAKANSARAEVSRCPRYKLRKAQVRAKPQETR